MDKPSIWRLVANSAMNGLVVLAVAVIVSIIVVGIAGVTA